MRDLIEKEQYIKCVEDLIRCHIGARLQIDEVSILLPRLRNEAQRLIQKYKINFIDCFQIVTILEGQFHRIEPKSILITADRDLAKAAREEGVNVWECITESPPL
jgi:hypothetical protein